ncbi:SDR family NAD(P)-dependent oxidoreductase [Alicyclobacillus kakegawensis]|uniref:SDR family NAD(P)-dependent oxidoreductase n=1 Tax=Alicyclobacillus kakegawensis TaxID=392012 RepID=UPI00083364E9|nr:SDR family NAD(P)-dependent oxidoreductase [Alicyclobacillus kakegawensis]
MNDFPSTFHAAVQRMFDVRDQVVVVTGAASGLGLAMAEIMAECGARVVLTDVNPAALEGAANRLRNAGLQAFSMELDVASAEQVDRVFERIEREHGAINTVFANAGIGTGGNLWSKEGKLESFSRDDWKKVIAINLEGVFWTMQAAARAMRPRRAGSIIVTASTAGLRAEPIVGYAYIAAKAAVVNLVRQAALDLAPFGVRVNAIAPGPFNTNIGGPGPRPAHVVEAFHRTVPLGRWAEPHEIQGLALFLASPAASFVTGGVYAIDGGALALSQCDAQDLEQDQWSE